MADLLRRALAPLTEEAWNEIEETAARVIKSQLTARALVDFDGPHGWDYAAVNLGRLEMAKSDGPYDVPWGRRLVLPLLETRVPFKLDQMELDTIARGAKDADLGSVEDAARRVALFEESAIYNGFEPAGIEGIIPCTGQDPVELPKNTREFPEAVARAAQAIRLAGVSGPLKLVLGNEAWTALMQSGTGGYPPQRIIRNLLESDPMVSPAIDGGVLVAAGEGNFELTVGQDFAVGYASHDRNQVELYLTESFTFRVLEPMACVRLAPQ